MLRNQRNRAAFLFIAANLSAFLCSGVVAESRFTELPQSVVIPEGLPAAFRCRASTLDNISYSWTHNGLPVKNSSWLDQNDGILSIKAVNRIRDAGDYVCIVQNVQTGAREATPSATLEIVWLQSAAVQLASPAIQEGDHLILKCIIVGGGSDHIVVEWFRNGQKLSKEAGKFEILRRKLHIHNLTKADNGIYRCAGHNEAGSVFSRRNFILRIPPKRARVPCHGKNLVVIRNLQKGDEEVNLCREKRKNRDLDLTMGRKQEQMPVIVDEGLPVRLSCAFSQEHLPLTIRWRKDGKPFRSLDINVDEDLPMRDSAELSGDVSIVREDPRVTISQDSGNLMFTESVATDEGNYECQVVEIGTNELKFSSPLYDLQVIEHLKFMPKPTSKNLELGAVGKLHCKAQGSPSPQVKWRREGSQYVDESLEDINGTLIFKNVTGDHRGNYTCTAKNRQGEIHATVSVYVVMSPRFLVAPEGPIQATEMGTAWFHCQAIGDPKPTVQWDKDLEYLSLNGSDEGRFRLLSNGTLYIAEVHPEDEGKYGCTIGNSAGLKREEVRLVVKSPGEASVDEEPSDGFTITRAVLLTMSFAAAYIILVVGLMVWCRLKRQARKNRLNAAGKENGGATNVEGGDADGKNGEVEPCLKVKSVKKANGVTGIEIKSDDASSGHSKGSKKSTDEFEKITLSRSALSDIIQIGRGEFGEVFVGRVRSKDVRPHENGKIEVKISEENEKRRSKTSIEEFNEIKVDGDVKKDEYKLVLIKALNKVKDESACAEFKRQMDLFRSVSYKSVTALYGVCRDKDPHYLVLEYTDWGDLKQFLLATAGKTSSEGKKSPPPLNVPQILTLAHQIARGMDAIYRAKFIHRDLATRNCVISSDFRAKISFSALSRDKYSREYFKYRNQVLPLRWLAPECLQDDDYSTKSDVWAYGVLIWELFTQAVEIPFENLTNEQVFAQVQAGQVEWTVAEKTPECLRPILMTCWATSTKERPSFSQLTVALVNALKNECPTKDSQ